MKQDQLWDVEVFLQIHLSRFLISSHHHSYNTTKTTRPKEGHMCSKAHLGFPARSVSLLKDILSPVPPSLPFLCLCSWWAAGLSAALGHLVAGSTCSSRAHGNFAMLPARNLAENWFKTKRHTLSQFLELQLQMTSFLDTFMFAKCLGMRLWSFCYPFASQTRPAWGAIFCYFNFIISLPQLLRY